jgi:dihydroorotate dehydrogenase (fumarate)
MDLTTKYLGLDLNNPLVIGASPISGHLDACKAYEDAGASALVVHSLWMEQIATEQKAAMEHMDAHANSSAEATTYFVDHADFRVGPDEYLANVFKLKEALDIPVVGSLNGVTTGGWTHHAKLIEEAGADALELNVYYLPTDPTESPADVEQRYVDVLKAVKEQVNIPVAVKLPYFFTAPVHLAKRLDEAGADALVLFNRVYQPDIDTDMLAFTPVRPLSTSASLRNRILWTAACWGHVKAGLAISGGVHTGEDLIKAMMAGADVAQVVSAFLLHGPPRAKTILEDVAVWMDEHEYDSIEQMQGSMSLQNSPNPESFERANYMQSLNTWTP